MKLSSQTHMPKAIPSHHCSVCRLWCIPACNAWYLWLHYLVTYWDMVLFYIRSVCKFTMYVGLHERFSSKYKVSVGGCHIRLAWEKWVLFILSWRNCKTSLLIGLLDGNSGSFATQEKWSYEETEFYATQIWLIEAWAGRNISRLGLPLFRVCWP